MKNDEIANLKDSIENTLGNIPETMQAVYDSQFKTKEPTETEVRDNDHK